MGHEMSNDLPSFPKIFALGDRHTRCLGYGDIEITEKVDGSQFVFANIDGEVLCRSKGQMILEGNVPKMFNNAWNAAHSLPLSNGMIYFSEYLDKPKHNILEYGRVPNNHLALFGIMDAKTKEPYQYRFIKDEAERIGVEVVPLLYEGKGPVQDIDKLLDRESFLGKQLIEGFVVKKYEPMFIGGMLFPISAGKFVSERFKEKHQTDWQKSSDKLDIFLKSFTSEARWAKAVQRKRENETLLGSPKDIGPLIAEIKKDLLEEESENIKEGLLRHFEREIVSNALRGFPEWYKKRLLDANTIHE